MTNELDAQNSLLALIRSILNAHSAILFMPDASGNCSPVMAFSDSAPYVQPASIEPGKGLVGWILRQKKPLVVNNVAHNYLGYYAGEEAEHVRAFMGCPVQDGGILCVDSIRPRDFTQQDLILLHRFAPQLTRQIQSEKLAREALVIQRHFDAISDLVDLEEKNPGWADYLQHFLQLVIKGTDFDYAALIGQSNNGSTYTLESETRPVLAASNTAPANIPTATGGLVGWVFRNGTAVHIDGTDGSAAVPLFGNFSDIQQFKTVICLPIQTNRMTNSVLCVASTEAHELPQNLRNFVRTMARHLTQFLEAVYLRYRIRTLLPQAQVHSTGARVYDPDTASIPVKED